MKTKFHSSFVTQPVVIALLATFTLFTFTLRAPAQDTTISAAGFQRLVYSAQLETDLALHPGLEASLKVLLTMQRRNPNADPTALVNVLTNALQIYRTREPFCVRADGYPDEVLAAYLDALRQVPAHTNFVSADLSLLNVFMLNAADSGYDTNYTQLDLVNSAKQQLFSTMDEALHRQTLVDDCVARAQRNGDFAAAMDSLLWPETGLWLGETPAEIIGNTNSPLHDDSIMTNLLASSAASGYGSFTVSSNELTVLFNDEMSNVWATAQTNLDTLAQINQSQPDWMAYLTNQTAIAADSNLLAAVQQNQPARLACDTAAVLMQSKLLPVNTQSPKILQAEKIVSAADGIAAGVASMCVGDFSGAGGVLSGEMDLFNVFAGVQSPQDAMAAQIQNIETMIGDLSKNMNYRFDRVDQSLDTMFTTMNNQFDQINITLNNQGQGIAQLNGDVNQIRGSLMQVQGQLDVLSTVLIRDLAFSDNQDLMGDINHDLLYQTLHPGNGPIAYSEYQTASDLFKTYATADASGPLNCPPYPTSASLADQLSLTNLNFNLNYIKDFLDGPLGQNTGGNTYGADGLVNPDEWFTAAYASLQLAGENPMYFRKYSASDLSPIIARGQNDADFCASLTFSPGTTNINWDLWNALESYYQSSLDDFKQQVAAVEATNAINQNFALNTWRQWDAAAPRVTATNTALLAVTPKNLIAAGVYHGLAVKPDGTVVGWGADNPVSPGQFNYGQATPPAGLSNVVAVAAGGAHSLALRSDGTVVAWGAGFSYNPSDGIDYGQSIVPTGLSNVVAIAAGTLHSLALKSDGTVVGWGLNTWGQANVPPQAGNHFVTVAAGDQDTLLLRANTSSGVNNAQAVTFVPAEIPYRVVPLFENCNRYVINELPLAGGLCDAANNLAGGRLLVAAVLQLGMPYTLAHDGILHSFLYGSDSVGAPLMDTGAATNFLAAQDALLQASPSTAPETLGDEATLRFVCFTNRLYQCLTNLQAIGQPEIPRLLGHTLRLLNLCKAACTTITNTPPPALETLRVANQPSLLLYGEPYVNYTLQSCDSLSAPNWTTVANLVDGQTNSMPVSSGPQRFYRTVTDLPSFQ